MAKKRKSLTKVLRRDFNILIGTVLFVMLIGIAFAIDWLFGIFFVAGFVLSILNKTLEHKPLIPILIFVGGIIIRTSLFLFVPRIIEAGSWADLIIAVVMLLIVLFIGFSIRRGKV